MDLEAEENTSIFTDVEAVVQEAADQIYSGDLEVGVGVECDDASNVEERRLAGFIARGYSCTLFMVTHVTGDSLLHRFGRYGRNVVSLHVMS